MTCNCQAEMRLVNVLRDCLFPVSHFFLTFSSVRFDQHRSIPDPLRALLNMSRVGLTLTWMS